MRLDNPELFETESLKAFEGYLHKLQGVYPVLTPEGIGIKSKGIPTKRI